MQMILELIFKDDLIRIEKTLKDARRITLLYGGPRMLTDDLTEALAALERVRVAWEDCQRVSIPAPCPACNGSGTSDAPHPLPCSACGGTGEVKTNRN